jgi:hypothetical protein
MKCENIKTPEFAPGFFCILGGNLHSFPVEAWVCLQEEKAPECFRGFRISGKLDFSAL